MASGNLSVSNVGNNGRVPCLTEHQKFYIKRQATRTGRNVSHSLTLPLLTNLKYWICLPGDKLQRKFQAWLAPPDPWKNHDIANRSRHSGAGAWFVQGGMLSEWTASGPSSLLWIQGKCRSLSNSIPLAEGDCFCPS